MQKEFKQQIKKTHALNKQIKNKPLGVMDSEVPTLASGSSREKLKHEKLGWFQKRKFKKHPDRSYFITMFFSNGTCKEFVIVSNDEVFTYKKRMYYLRFENSFFNLTQNQNHLLYFDDYPVPINKQITKTGDKAFFSVSPDNLKPLLKMEYVKVLSQNLELDKYLKMSAIFSIINAGLGVIMILMLYNLGK